MKLYSYIYESDREGDRTLRKFSPLHIYPTSIHINITGFKIPKHGEIMNHVMKIYISGLMYIFFFVFIWEIK